MAYDDRVKQLVNVARDARRFFRNASAGNARNGPHDVVHLNRSLARVLESFDDYEPCHDEDRREWLARHALTLEAANVAAERRR